MQRTKSRHIYASAVVALALAVMHQAGAARSDDEMTARRERMVARQIEARGVADARVLDAMRAVERHRFVPASAIDHAYDDSPLRIGHDQTISQPYIVALMTELLEPKSTHRVLEIGTGSGYQAAVLSMLVAEVYSIEIVPELGSEATARLKELGYGNVTTRIGDGYQGWTEHAPFDGIIVTAAPPEVPPRLVEQLRDGGRMVLPVGTDRQELIILEKHGNELSRRVVTGVRFVPMVHGDE